MINLLCIAFHSFLLEVFVSYATLPVKNGCSDVVTEYSDAKYIFMLRVLLFRLPVLNSYFKD